MFPVATQVLRTFILDDREEITLGKIYDLREVYWGGAIPMEIGRS